MYDYSSFNSFLSRLIFDSYPTVFCVPRIANYSVLHFVIHRISVMCKSMTNLNKIENKNISSQENKQTKNKVNKDFVWFECRLLFAHLNADTMNHKMRAQCSSFLSDFCNYPDENR